MDMIGYGFDDADGSQGRTVHRALMNIPQFQGSNGSAVSEDTFAAILSQKALRSRIYYQIDSGDSSVSTTEGVCLERPSTVISTTDYRDTLTRKLSKIAQYFPLAARLKRIGANKPIHPIVWLLLMANVAR